jgi:hypothetical protein
VKAHLKANDPMTSQSPTEAVLEALARQQSHTLGGELLPAEPINAPRGIPQSKPAQLIGSGNRCQLTASKDSLIKARYALTVLRVAQTADRETAARLVRGVARDFPHPNEVPEIAGMHLRAIESFCQLAVALGDGTSVGERHLWKAALDAAQDWLRAIGNEQPRPTG